MKGYGGPSGSNETGNMVYAPTVIDRAAFNQGENAQYEPRIETGETMSSLVAKGPHAVAQPIPVLAGEHPQKGFSIDVCPTLPAAMGMGGGHTPLVPHPVAQPIGINGNIAGTIDANYFKGCGSANFGERDVVAQPLYYESHPQDSRVNGPKDVADTVSAKYGTGGGNTPLVQQPIAIDWRTAQVDQGITQTLKTDLAKMSGPCIAVDTYNQTTNDHTTQTIRSQYDTDHIGAVLQPIPINTMTMLGRPSDDKNPRMGLGIGNPGEPQNTLTKTHSHAVAQPMDFRKSFYEIKKDVLVRKYPVDTDSLKRCLKKHKKISNNKISELLNLPKTKIEHWFRQDDSFAIPSAEHWFQLKEILHIETNIFDQSITEFIIEENKYDSTNRIYDSTFPSPTLTASNSGSDNYITPMAIRRLTPKTT